MSIQSVSGQTPLASVAVATSVASSNQTVRHTPTEETAAPEPISKITIKPTTAAEQKQQLSDAVKAVKEFIQPQAGNLEFTMDEETGDTIIKIVDSSSGELIRQIPSKEMLEIAKALDRLQGLLVKQKA